MGPDGGGSVFHPRPDIRCPEVGKTGSRVSRLMNGKDGEDAYRNGLGVAYGSGGGSLRRRQSGMAIRLRCGVRGGDPPHLPERDFRPPTIAVKSEVRLLASLCPDIATRNSSRCVFPSVKTSVLVFSVKALENRV